MPDPAVAAAPNLWSTVDAEGTNISTRFLAALASGSQRSITRVDVYNDTTFLQTLPDVTDGSVTVDATASVRRTCSLSLVSQGRTLDNLVPKVAGDLLHPGSGNELHIYRGFQYADGSQDLCQLGVFRMSRPQVTDTGDSITIAINGSDRSSFISRIKWAGPFTIAANTDLATAVRSLISNRWRSVANPLTYKITPTNPVPDGFNGAGHFVSVPTKTLGIDNSSNDPWADAVQLASDAGMELFFDPFGAVVMQPIVIDATGGTTFDGLYEEGVTCTMVEASKTLDETATYNGVVATGSGTAGNNLIPPVTPVKNQSTIFGVNYPGCWNTDPTSPTYYDPSQPDLSLWGPTPYQYDTTSIPGFQSFSMIGSVTNGSIVISGVVDAVTLSSGTPGSLVVGSPITGDPAYIASGATIVAFDATSITMSAPAILGAGTRVNVTGGGPPDSQVEAQAKINSVGQALLAKLMSFLDESTFNAVPNPALWEDDVISILRSRIGISSTVVGTGNLTPTSYIVSAITLPLDVSTAMGVTLRPQAAAA